MAGDEGEGPFLATRCPTHEIEALQEKVTEIEKGATTRLRRLRDEIATMLYKPPEQWADMRARASFIVEKLNQELGESREAIRRVADPPAHVIGSVISEEQRSSEERRSATDPFDHGDNDHACTKHGTDLYPGCRECFTEVESGAGALADAWREAKGFGDLREGSEGWKSVRRMDAALEAHDKARKT